MKDELQQFITDLNEFVDDLRSICNRQTAHDALISQWDHIRHDNDLKIPLIMSGAVHLLVLIMAITAPFLMSSSLNIPEVYTVNLYQVSEASLQAPTPKKPVTIAKTAT